MVGVGNRSLSAGRFILIGSFVSAHALSSRPATAHRSVGAALVKLTVMCIIRCAGSRRMSQGNPSLFSKRGAPSLSVIASAQPVER
jgi:hypothetical protein